MNSETLSELVRARMVQAHSNHPLFSTLMDVVDEVIRNGVPATLNALGDMPKNYKGDTLTVLELMSDAVLSVTSEIASHEVPLSALCGVEVYGLTVDDWLELHCEIEGSAFMQWAGVER
jgi:hypothetical protein